MSSSCLSFFIDELISISFCEINRSSPQTAWPASGFRGDEAQMRSGSFYLFVYLLCVLAAGIWTEPSRLPQGRISARGYGAATGGREPRRAPGPVPSARPVPPGLSPSRSARRAPPAVRAVLPHRRKSCRGVRAPQPEVGHTPPRPVRGRRCARACQGAPGGTGGRGSVLLAERLSSCFCEVGGGGLWEEGLIFLAFDWTYE